MDSLLNLINTVRSNQDKPLLSKLSASDRLLEDCELRSIDLAELTVRIEAQYGIDVFENQTPRTVGNIWNQISSE